MSDEEKKITIYSGSGCLSECLEIIIIIALVIFVFCYGCDSREFITDITAGVKGYVDIIDSVWHGQ